jgi:16S rRNA (cytidine1402-2'-O)-methyltransferase
MLIIIPTPLGNLEDITIRAIKSIRNCDIVAAEDTRRTIKLLNKFAIKKTILRYNEHSERSVREIFDLLASGKKIVLVSDSGTPCISDPGTKLLRLAINNNIPIEILPGPSAVTLAASGSGMPVDSFVFLGFLPRSRTKILKILGESLSFGKTVIIYESPWRVKNLLETISQEFGQDTQVTIARELTKIHEEWLRGNAESVLKAISDKKEIRGEIVVLIKGHLKKVPVPFSIWKQK